MKRSINNPQASTNLRSISRCSKSLSMDLQITHVALGIIDLFMNSDLTSRILLETLQPKSLTRGGMLIFPFSTMILLRLELADIHSCQTLRDL